MESQDMRREIVKLETGASHLSFIKNNGNIKWKLICKLTVKMLPWAGGINKKSRIMDKFEVKMLTNMPVFIIYQDFWGVFSLNECIFASICNEWISIFLLETVSFINLKFTLKFSWKNDENIMTAFVIDKLNLFTSLILFLANNLFTCWENNAAAKCWKHDGMIARQ